MKITIEYEDKEFYRDKATFESPDGADIDEMFRLLRKILFWMGFDYHNINDIISEEE